MQELDGFATSCETASRDSLKSLNVQAFERKSQSTENLTVAILSKTYHCLETLQLHRSRIEINHLLAFVKRQPMLRRLDLHNMVITAEEKALKLLEKDGIESMLGVAGPREGITYQIEEQ